MIDTSVNYRIFKFAFEWICDVKFTFDECKFLLNLSHCCMMTNWEKLQH